MNAEKKRPPTVSSGQGPNKNTDYNQHTDYFPGERKKQAKFCFQALREATLIEVFTIYARVANTGDQWAAIYSHLERLGYETYTDAVDAFQARRRRK